MLLNDKEEVVQKLTLENAMLEGKIDELAQMHSACGHRILQCKQIHANNTAEIEKLRSSGIVIARAGDLPK